MTKDPKKLREFIDNWRKQWDTNKVPGCRQENCSKCSTHRAEKLSCPLQVAVLRKELEKN